jgi:sodium-coupled neutral amino acid transporter 11
MAFRYLSPSSPYALIDGAFLPTLAPTLQPVFGSKFNLLSPSSLILASISACSFLGHYLAPDFYHVLGRKETDKHIMKKFRRLTLFSFGGVCLINVAILAFGFLTFGGNSSGIILNNYSTADVGATICRLLMALSVIGSFPFLINASRSTFFQLTSQNGTFRLCIVLSHLFCQPKNRETHNTSRSSFAEDEVSKPQRRKVTAGLISFVTALALLLEDAGVVLSFTGAVMGSAMIYIFPAVLFLRSTDNQMQEGSLKMSRGLRVEHSISRFLLGLGSVAAGLGGAVTIINKTCPALLL